MIPDSLFEAAFAFRKTRLWHQLYDSQIFALRHSDGTIGYCCIMGIMGEHLALAVYPGEEGLAAYRRMGKDRSRLNEFELVEMMFSQSCVMCSFANKDDLREKDLAGARAYAKANGIALRGSNAYPQFQDCKPGFYPWYLEEEKAQTYMLEGLRACLEVSRKLAGKNPDALGFVDGAPFSHDIPLLKRKGRGWKWETHALPKPRPVAYPAVTVTDELRLERIRRAGLLKGNAPAAPCADAPDGKAQPKDRQPSRGRREPTGQEWACDVVMFPRAMRQPQDPNPDGGATEPRYAPYFPMALTVIEQQTRVILCTVFNDNMETYLPTFTDAILNLLEEQGAPAHLYVRNDRAYALFRELAQKLAIPLTQKKYLPVLTGYWKDLLAHTAQSGEDEARRGAFSYLEMLSDPATLASLPDAVFQELVKTVLLETPADLPCKLLSNLNAEQRRRTLRS